MKIVGLTGGMGVGKSTVAAIFESNGFPVFNSDTRAKELMVETKQDAAFCVKEAAILFESGSYKDCDYTVAVIAPDSIRIPRIISRDHLTIEEVKKRLQHQWAQEKVVKLSNFHIVNDSDFKNLQSQVMKIISILKDKC